MWKKRKLLVAKSPKIEWSGEGHEDSCRYVVGVVNKSTGKVSLHEATSVMMEHSIRDENVQESALIKDKSYVANNELGQTFGTKKRKKAIKTQEMNQIRVENMLDVAGKIKETIAETAPSILLKADLDAQTMADRLIPPCNLDAIEPSQVYSLEDIIPAAVADSIDIKKLWKARELKECFALLAPLEYVQPDITSVLMEKKNKSELKNLVFFACMIRMYSMLEREACAIDLSSRMGDMSPVVCKRLQDQFLEKIVGDGRPRFKRTDKCKDKLLIYILCVALILNNFVLDLNQFASDLRLASTGLAQKTKELGARVQNRKVEGKTVKVANLTLPLQFPHRSKGEEISALVFDFGTHSSKVGFGGEDGPRQVFPSQIGTVHDASQMDLDASTTSRASVIMGESELFRPREGLQLKSPFEDGLVSDWDAFERLWEYSYEKALRVQPTQHPVMFSDPSWDTKANREKLCELAFEKFGVPGFYLGRSAVLSSFAAGRATALVVDSGASTTSVVPVFDGYIVKKAMQKAPIGGNYLNAQIKHYLTNQLRIDMTPKQLIKSRSPVDASMPPVFEKKQVSGITKSYEDYAITQTINEFKETIVAVSEQASLFNERDLSKRPGKNYEFPTGYSALFGLDRFRLGETLFNPSASFNTGAPVVANSIPGLISSSLQLSDVEIQAQLGTNVVLTGANTLLHGFADRVYNELHKLTQSKVRIQAAGGSSERKFGPWIGGSILSSLSSFHQLWISKAQYEETGVSVEKKIY
ncbi:Actin-like 6A [Kappamyces sp. JEL0829]|nr:Actin-like 6A [Kappamyces sp. JEL0829]